MGFQIKALPRENFAHLFDLSDDALAAHGAVRQKVTENPGTPCRVSLQDAEVGETVILINYEHQPANSPYRASHAIFVRENAQQAHVDVNVVPDVIQSRLVSLRCFDHLHMMVHADVMPGDAVSSAISAAFDNAQIAYAHIHNAKPGCFAASVHRVGEGSVSQQ
ncbi:MAG: DUF1203 domain-containing protein [Pseudomonadota bacterium]